MFDMNKDLFKACIFDLDGVIVDTAGFHYQSWKRLADELGFEFTEEQNEEMKGISRMDSLDIVLEIGKISVSKEDKIRMAEQKNLWYRDHLANLTETAILPGVHEFLMELKKADIPFALGSASKNAGLVMSKIGISTLFHTIVDGNDTTNSKPDPEVFHKGAEALDIEPQHIVVFEDSYKGLVAANTGGFISCGVGAVDNLPNADFVIDSFMDFSIQDLKSLIKYKVKT